MKRMLAPILALVAGLVSSGSSATEAVRLVMPFAAGSATDALSRVIADELETGLGRAVVVENRTGAAGRVGVQAVKSATPDGATLLFTPIAPMAVYQHVYPVLGYDPVQDFEPVSQVATFDFAVAVGADIPADTLSSLVEWLKAHPERANYGTPGAGTLPHFFAVLFGRETGLDLRHVPYRGTSAAINDLLAGQLPMVFTNTGELLELHKAGRIRILATSSTSRSPFLPGVPTFQEAGYAIAGAGWHGVFAPRGTPADVLDRFNQLITAALQKEQVKERIIAMGFEPTGTSRSRLAEILNRDAAMWAPAVKAARFTPDQQ
ncbi:Bug family tripartite tricarboxylate transporter substrate binding protein [Microvirga aerilata]|uniref:Bug family tripartite tricarboxylate transporter substrate binding protein n=1 Tax=Microvirga aerilata TaxID=670292 RepID=A0A936ZEA1_9HYPH|nr:Bug family tripartite tricarboxylate transporter substrate binding protein [Microvirga aerilata]MBL0405274.1 Bug family tripartite tricarboxylate transporter substrate binding protein [Microvirga aerilata]